MCFYLGNLSTQTHRIGLRHGRRMSWRGDPANGAYYVKSMYSDLVHIHQSTHTRIPYSEMKSAPLWVSEEVLTCSIEEKRDFCGNHVLLNSCITCSCLEQALNWDLYPETVVSWMKLYIQMASVYDFTNLLVPQFSQETYIQMTQV